MNTQQIKMYMEIAIMAILAISMFTIIYLTISKYSSISTLKSQIKGFMNKTELEIELNKKMSFFYSLVSNAAYIGLFGTTVGVMISLMSIGNNADQGALIKSLSLPSITACTFDVS